MSWLRTFGILLLSFVLLSCEQRRVSISNDEMQQVVWYVEDLAHGIERKPTELIFPDGTESMLRVAQWAQGNRQDGVLVRQPEPLQQRLTRWPIVAKGLAQGLVAYTESGQLRMVGETVDSVGVTDTFVQILEPAVRQENIDRVRTAQVVIGLTGVSQDLLRQVRLVEAFHSVRRQHAVDAGGQLWTEPSPSSSQDEPTQSESPPEFSPRRDP